MSLNSLFHVRSPGWWKECGLTNEYWILQGMVPWPGMPEKWQHKRCGWPRHHHNLSGQPQRQKESWRKLDFGYRQPQGTCDHKLPHGCNPSTKKQIFFGCVSHCPKSVFSFECLWGEIMYLCFILTILGEWSSTIRVTWDFKFVKTGHTGYGGFLWLLPIGSISRLTSGAHSFILEGPMASVCPCYL